MCCLSNFYIEKKSLKLCIRVCIIYSYGAVQCCRRIEYWSHSYILRANLVSNSIFIHIMALSGLKSSLPYQNELNLNKDFYSIVYNVLQFHASMRNITEWINDFFLFVIMTLPNYEMMEMVRLFLWKDTLNLISIEINTLDYVPQTILWK